MSNKWNDYRPAAEECGGCGCVETLIAKCAELEAQLAEYEWVNKTDSAVLDLAKTMQFKLDKNKHKECDMMNPDGNGSHWSHCGIGWLLGRLKVETIELEEAIDTGTNSEAIQRECADVANFAMMIHDNVSLPQQSKREFLQNGAMEAVTGSIPESVEGKANFMDTIKPVTVLPDCIWQRRSGGVIHCEKTDSGYFFSGCSKRCTSPEPIETSTLNNNPVSGLPLKLYSCSGDSVKSKQKPKTDLSELESLHYQPGQEQEGE